MNRLIVYVCLVFGMLFLSSGCAYKAGYNPTYLPDENPEHVSSKSVLLIMADEDENFTFTGSPTSLTGSTTTVTLPLGFILKEVSEEILEDRFSGGVDFSNEYKEAYRYDVSFQPSFKHFEFRFNQLKNFGFAITPEVNLEVLVTFLDNSGGQIFSKLYNTGYISGEPYMISGSPAEEVSQVLHEGLYKVLKQSFDDAESELLGRY